MLLGGMKVVGIYIWVNESLFKNSTIAICQTVKGVAEAASLMIDWSEALLIHIGYSPLRWTCRNCSLAANITSSSLRPCDFKMGKVLGSLQTFRCTYNFDLRLPISHDDKLDIKRFSDVLRSEITVHAKELSGAKALINGKLVTEDEQCASDDFHEVEFLVPFLQDKYLAFDQIGVLGVLLFRGFVCSLAYLNSKEPVSQALLDIKEDIIRSLQSRLEIMCDEAERYIESVAEIGQETSSDIPSDQPVPHFDLQAQRKQCSLSFPRRVFVPWLEGTYICDYIQSSETMEVLKDHCTELMSIEVPTDTSEILEPESEASAVITTTTKSFWDIAIDNSLASSPVNSVSKNGKIGNGKPAKSVTFKPTLSILVLIIAVIVGLVFYVTGR